MNSDGRTLKRSFSRWNSDWLEEDVLFGRSSTFDRTSSKEIGISYVFRASSQGKVAEG
jgi:hypothetical protein